jgi:hypothetical protein
MKQYENKLQMLQERSQNVRLGVTVSYSKNIRPIRVSLDGIKKVK